MTLKHKLIFSALLAFGSLQAQYTEEINSNRPGMSQSAFAVGKTIAQVEAGVNGIHEQHSVLNSEANGMTGDLALRYGAFDENLEFMLDMQYRADQFKDAIYTYNRNDFSRFTFGAKYLIYDPNKFYEKKVNLYSWKANHKISYHNLIPAIGFYGGFNFMPKNPFTFPNDRMSAKAVLLLQNNFGRWAWINNVIYDKIGTSYPSLGVISTVTRGFNEKWSGFLEFQAYKSDFYADGVGRVGAAYLFTENMQFDASISANIKDTPAILYGGVGFSWRFTANYQDVMLAGKGDREDLLEEDQKKQQKEKDKRKKEREERKKLLEQEPVGPELQPGN